jgi:hypothetical protein
MWSITLSLSTAKAGATSSNAKDSSHCGFALCKERHGRMEGDDAMILKVGLKYPGLDLTTNGDRSDKPMGMDFTSHINENLYPAITSYPPCPLCSHW